jgi:eukaryotic-like serine/threonine-protein kinase
MASAPAIPSELPQIGEVLDGKYVIEDVLGAGGVGIVVAARHVLLGQRVAIKFLLKSATPNAEAAERLLREARAISAIKSDHVTRVLDVGRLPEGAPYMVMEHLVGTDLGRLRRARGTFPPSDAVDAVLQACEAIAEAHAMGIVHRDLKPSNLFVVARPDRSLSVKVLDFGLSKITHDRGGRLTATGVVAGSPQYMAPEQMQSLKDVDHRADIWSIGVILYYLMAGKRPYEGKTIPVIWAGILGGPPRALRSITPSVPPGLEAVVSRCLVADPARRMPSLTELAQELAPFGSERGRASVAWIIRASEMAARG